MELYDHTPDIEIVAVIVEGVLTVALGRREPNIYSAPHRAVVRSHRSCDRTTDGSIFRPNRGTAEMRLSIYRPTDGVPEEGRRIHEAAAPDSAAANSHEAGVSRLSEISTTALQ
jgi:hypothetical protein